MRSYLWQMGFDEGVIRGRAAGLARAVAEGEARFTREICADLARACHPRVATRVLPTILACQQTETLRAWILACKLSDASFVKLVTGEPASPSRARPRRSVPAGKRR